MRNSSLRLLVTLRVEQLDFSVDLGSFHKGALWVMIYLFIKTVCSVCGHVMVLAEL